MAKKLVKKIGYFYYLPYMDLLKLGSFDMVFSWKNLLDKIIEINFFIKSQTGTSKTANGQLRCM